MSGERVEKVLEWVATDWIDAWFNAPAGEQLRMKQSLALVLEERLGPLLRAGQAMRDVIEPWELNLKDDTNGMLGNAWDAALAALERER